MSFKFACVGLVMASLSAGSLGAGCAVPSSSSSATEEASASELSTHASGLVGAYRGGPSRPPTFEGIVFQADGTFFADVFTGVYCVTAPCPSHARLAGRFEVNDTTVTLSPGDADALEDERVASFYGRYSYTLEGDQLSLARAEESWDGWSNALHKELSYCAEAVDCGGQALPVAECTGAWACGEQRSCKWACTPSAR